MENGKFSKHCLNKEFFINWFSSGKKMYKRPHNAQKKQFNTYLLKFLYRQKWEKEQTVEISR